LDDTITALNLWKTNHIDAHAIAFLRTQVVPRTILCYMTGFELLHQDSDDGDWQDMYEASAIQLETAVGRLADMDTVIGQIVVAANAARNTGGSTQAKLLSVLNAGLARAQDVVDVDGRHVSFGLAAREVARFFHYRVRVCMAENPLLGTPVPSCSAHVAANQFNTGFYALFFIVVQPKCQEQHLAVV